MLRGEAAPEKGAVTPGRDSPPGRGTGGTPKCRRTPPPRPSPEPRWGQRRGLSAPHRTAPHRRARRPAPSAGRAAGGRVPARRDARGYRCEGWRGRHTAARLLRPGPARRGGGAMRALPSPPRGDALRAAAQGRAPATRGTPRRRRGDGGSGTASPHPRGPRPPPGQATRSPSAFVPEAPPGAHPPPLQPGRGAPRRCPRPARARSAPSGRGGERGTARRLPPAPPPPPLPPPPSRAAIFSKSSSRRHGRRSQRAAPRQLPPPRPPAAHGTGWPRRRRYGHLTPAGAATFPPRSAPSPAAPVEDGSWGKDWKLQPASEEIRRRRGKSGVCASRPGEGQAGSAGRRTGGFQ
ncbi:sterile alpha motif domain-containing protein 1-like [Phalacrocorax carbo]|uniref:sterile alpha motif domain-containing protein 1-like n=1 Tax=Phalacrocorax carbo TaxID=9209 RepID=UPI00311A82A0